MLKSLSVRQIFATGRVTRELVPYALFHDCGDEARMLRRFKRSDLNQKYITSLTGTVGSQITPSGFRTTERGTITATYIDQMLSDPSVKFITQAGLKNPYELFELIIKTLHAERDFGKAFYWEDSFISNADQKVPCKKCLLEIKFSAQVGETSIVKSDDPILSERSTFKRRPALLEPDSGVIESFEMSSANDPQRGTTDCMCVILGKRECDLSPFLLSAYSGEYCPPFPKVLMSAAEQAELQAYWDQRVELILS